MSPGRRHARTTCWSAARSSGSGPPPAGAGPRCTTPRHGKSASYGPYEQVSRLGNPLFNEVIVPMAEKDLWNAARSPPGRPVRQVRREARAGAACCRCSTRGVFPNLAAYTKPRADLQAILLTGIPKGVVPGFQNYTGPVLADLLRLNLAVPPSKKPNPIGLVAGDPAGFPNGRRVIDDVVAIELRAVAGATIPLVDPSYTPDAAAAGLTDGTTQHQPAVPGDLPVPGHPGRRLPDQAGRTGRLTDPGCRARHFGRQLSRDLQARPKGREPPRRAGSGGAGHRRRHRRAGDRDAGRPVGSRDGGPAGRPAAAFDSHTVRQPRHSHSHGRWCMSRPERSCDGVRHTAVFGELQEGELRVVHPAGRTGAAHRDRPRRRR